MSKISVIIVNYNGASFIVDCLESLFKSQCECELEIVLIDNASKDDSLDVLSSYKNKITLIKNNHNSGFSRANNIAIKYSSGDYLFLLNNDTVVETDTIQKLYEFYIKLQDPSVIVPKLKNEDGSTQRPGSILGQWRFLGNTPRKVPFVAGAALFMSSRVYTEIGGLDEHLYFYNDDVDLCKTLSKKGYDIIYYPLSELIHFGGLSTSTRKIGTIVEGYRGSFYICHKHYGYFFYQVYRFVILFDVLPRLIYHGIMSLAFKRYRLFFSAYLDVLKICMTGDFLMKYPKVDVEVL